MLLLDGCFLAITGAVQVLLEMLGYYAGAGPFGDVFDGSPYTLGWVENHGFALITGTLLLTVAIRKPQRHWHVLGLSVHGLLGAANLLFWSSFVAFGTVGLGVAAPTSTPSSWLRTATAFGTPHADEPDPGPTEHE